MVSFEELVLDEQSPIYLQIVRYIQRGIVAGRIRDQEELPSRRVLSALLGVNPNTVQKAYRQLEEEGIVTSRAGAKSVVEADQAQVARIRGQLMEGDVRALIASLRQMGVSRAEALERLDGLWREEEEKV